MTVGVDLQTLCVVLEQVILAVLLVDETGHIRWGNAAAGRLLGYALPELVGQPLDVVIPGPFRARHTDLCAAYRAAPEARPMGVGRDLLALCQDGSTFPVEVSLSPVQAPAELLVACFLVDITVRRNAERTLRESEARVRWLADIPQQNPYPLMRALPSGDLIYANPASDALLAHWGLAPESPQLPATYLTIAQTALESGERQTITIEQGEQTFLLTFSPHPESEYVNIYSFDITQQQAAERLREALTHMLVHDLRNPLGAIYTGLQYLLMDLAAPSAPELEKVLRIAYHNAERMIRLINDILDVSRLESGQMPVECAPAQLETLATGAFEALSALLQDKHLTPRVDIPPTLPPVNVDGDLIARVFQNLIGNAIKFTPEGGVITVQARVAERPGWIAVAVRDTGPGIPAELRERIFQKFVTGRQREKGSGLGLAFCKLAVAAHGGEIWVENLATGGAAFTFTLPGA